MDNIILFISYIFKGVLNYSILVLALIEFVIMGRTVKRLSMCLSKINSLIGVDKKTNHIMRKGKEIKKESLSTSIMDWDEYKKFQFLYKNAEKHYSIFSLIIQLFTLLGILGTVAGLFISLQNGEINGDNIYVGVGFALTSTILGIIFAIVFKVFDIVITSHYITQIDSNMEIFEKEYNVNMDIAEHDNEEIQ